MGYSSKERRNEIPCHTAKLYSYTSNFKNPELFNQFHKFYPRFLSFMGNLAQGIVH